MRFTLKFMQLIFRRNVSNAAAIDEIDLIGKHFVHPSSYTKNEYKSLMWTALDLKERLGDVKRKGLQSENSPNLENSKITLILKSACLQTQLTTANAAKILKTTINPILYPNWTKLKPNDFGKMLGMVSDIILIDAPHQKKLENLSKASKAPVVVLKSCQQMALQALTDIMTAYVHYGHLENRTMALIGEPSSLFNSYLLIAPMFGIHIKYMTCKAIEKPAKMPMSPSSLQQSRSVFKTYKVNIEECDTIHQVLNGSHMIATNVNELQHIVHSKGYKSAAPDHVFLHCLRKWCELFVREDLADSSLKKTNDLHWETVDNYQWIITALMLRLLKPHTHAIPKPAFV